MELTKFLRQVTLVLMCLLAITAAPATLAAPQTVLVPAYFYPAGDGLVEWNKLIAAGGKAKLVVIANPNSGPGTQVDSNYTAVLDRVHKAGITIIGYVSTSYGNRDPNLVTADMQQWVKFYPQIRGYFFDEQFSGKAKAAQYEKYFHSAHLYVKSPILYSNPGTECDEDYVKRTPSITEIIYENNIKVDSYTLPSWSATYKPHNFGSIAWAVAGADEMKAWVSRSKTLGVGSIFVTDNSMAANPYVALPSYWLDLLKASK